MSRHTWNYGLILHLVSPCPAGSPGSHWSEPMTTIVKLRTSLGSCPTFLFQTPHYKKDLVLNPVWWEVATNIFKRRQINIFRSNLSSFQWYQYTLIRPLFPASSSRRECPAIVQLSSFSFLLRIKHWKSFTVLFRLISLTFTLESF